MDNYKIKVNDEAESKEAQELFFELGYIVVNHVDNEKGFIVVSKEADSPFNFGYWCSVDKELTLPQLRDLVVLKRNDVKDATHRDKQQNSIYLTSDKVIYYWQGEWCKSAINKSNDYENYIANSLTPIAQPQDPALISGADAELVAQAKKFITSDHLNRFEAAEAHLEGHPVQFMLANGDFIDITSDTTLGIFEKDGGYSFRLKPQTIKLELELPKPFEPKVGEEYFYLNSGRESGFAKKLHDGKKLDYMATQFGAWRTEEEIKQVVEQLRKIRGTNS
ncbi:TPA: hypothetical protein NEV79_000971 [Acinetobacter baumannii]|uniref:hypothetical protein n=1 Tax=Acinetobacter baumannii TaxID=470 RepID=UPI0027420FDF|nr:hypothetical protein [Acinetobacter baumannii]MDP7927886.1 hypothetical protein [Acinetobacter baumannii]HCD9551662.1 hypothetical protein [Acinetobacter baumannii]HCD9566538.1 hypothetical protein [Acinetobacter baumannii]HCD9568566.1 hypothetical protein [Acinetobacter baumannii]HCD9608956.1 hypothetical protein [Acinetobacter baumannii]